MDFLYHGLVGVAISKSFGGLYPVPAAIAAMLPDLAGIMPFYYFKILEAKKDADGWFPVRVIRRCMTNTFAKKTDRVWYRSTHSLLSVAVVAGISRIVFPDAWLMLSLCYLSHILVDIPTHDGEFSTRLFYPLSDFHLPAYNWGTNPNIFLLFWVLLGGYYVLF